MDSEVRRPSKLVCPEIDTEREEARVTQRLLHGEALAVVAHENRFDQ